MNRIIDRVTRKNKELTEKLQFIREQNTKNATRYFNGTGLKHIFTLFEMVNEECEKIKKGGGAKNDDLCNFLHKIISEANPPILNSAICVASAALMIAEEHLPENGGGE